MEGRFDVIVSVESLDRVREQEQHLYAVAFVTFGRLAFAMSSPLMAVIAIAVLWLMLEESSYGQVYWGAGSSNFFDDREQLSLHTASGVRELKGFLTGLASIAIVIGIPLVLGRFGVPLREPVPWLPLGMLVFVHVGNGLRILSPRECGHCADNELAETLLASATVLLALLVPRPLVGKIGSSELGDPS